MKQEVITVGLDLAKSVFQVHAIGRDGAVLVRRKLRRAEVIRFFADLPTCLRERGDQGRKERCRNLAGPARQGGAEGHDARWTLKFAKGRPLPGGKPGIDIAIPSFGNKSSIAICRRYGFIYRGKVTNGARVDGRMPRDVVTTDNTASEVWADIAYRNPESCQTLEQEADCDGCDGIVFQ